MTVAVLLFASSVMQFQTRSEAKELAATQSIGDVVTSKDHIGTVRTSGTIGAKAAPAKTAPPIHIVYIHGINQVGMPATEPTYDRPSQTGLNPLSLMT